MKISRQDIAKAHVEYWLSTEMQNLKGGKGKICVFYQRGSRMRVVRQQILGALRKKIFGQFDSCVTC